MVTHNANTGKVQINGREYLTVAYRLTEFRKDHPVEAGWAVTTERIPAQDDLVVFKATVCDPEGRVVATGHAEEKRGSSWINRSSALENCETSAIGRALAAAGFIGSEFASADEVALAISLRAAAQPSANGNNGQAHKGSAAEWKVLRAQAHAQGQDKPTRPAAQPASAPAKASSVEQATQTPKPGQATASATATQQAKPAPVPAKAQTTEQGAAPATATQQAKPAPAPAKAPVSAEKPQPTPKTQPGETPAPATVAKVQPPIGAIPLTLPDVTRQGWETAIVPDELLPYAERGKKITWRQLIADTVRLVGQRKTFGGAQYLHIMANWQSPKVQRADVQAVVQAALRLRQRVKDALEFAELQTK